MKVDNTLMPKGKRTGEGKKKVWVLKKRYQENNSNIESSIKGCIKWAASGR